MTSSPLVLSFAIDKLSAGCISALSVFDGKLLASFTGFTQLVITSQEGSQISSITTNRNEELYDASWTPGGKIVYTTINTKKVVLTSESGLIIALSQMSDPRYFSISDDVMYLSDWQAGVYQSTDDGVNWSLVFEPIDNWKVWQVIKVTANHSGDFWSLAYRNGIFGVCSMDGRRLDGNVKVRIIDMPSSTSDRSIDLSRSKLSYDGNMNIFLSDHENKAVHIFSVTGQYHCQILSSRHIKKEPCKVAIDKKRKLLYVGQNEGLVGVFNLVCGAGSN